MEFRYALHDGELVEVAVRLSGSKDWKVLYSKVPIIIHSKLYIDTMYLEISHDLKCAINNLN